MLLLFWLYITQIRTLGVRLRIKERGKQLYIGPGTRFKGAKNVVIGDNVRIVGHSYFQAKGGLAIGSNVSIAEGCSILTLEHRFRDGKQLPYDSVRICCPVEIASNVWVGRNVTILPGIKIGEGSIVGAGSVVTRDVKPLDIVGGNPAVVIGHRDKEHYDLLVNRKAFFSIWKGFKGYRYIHAQE